jgi:hypothetical protein
LPVKFGHNHFEEYLISKKNKKEIRAIREKTYEKDHKEEKSSEE